MSGYNHARCGPDRGKYIQSDDADYNPNAGGSQRWEEMRPVR